MIHRLTKAKAGLECTVSGLESILSFPSRSSCGIMWYLAKRSILAFPCARFSTRVDLDLEASRIFRPTPRKTFLAESRAVVLCQVPGIQDWIPVARECTVSGLESMSRSESARVSCSLSWRASSQGPARGVSSVCRHCRASCMRVVCKRKHVLTKTEIARSRHENIF